MVWCMLDRFYTVKRAPCKDGALQREMDDCFSSLFYSFSRPICLIKLPNLDIHWNEVWVRSNVVLSERFFPLLAEVTKDKKYLTIAEWSRVKEEHGLIPSRYFRTWDVATLCPSVCLALNKDLIVVITLIEVMGLTPIDPDLNHYI